MPSKRDLLNEMGYEDAIVFENPSYDDSIIGVTTGGEVVYDYDKMVDEIAKKDELSPEDAEDFVSYNTIRALDYFATEHKPIVMFKLEE